MCRPPITDHHIQRRLLTARGSGPRRACRWRSVAPRRRVCFRLSESGASSMTRTTTDRSSYESGRPPLHLDRPQCTRIHPARNVSGQKFFSSGCHISARSTITAGGWLGARAFSTPLHQTTTQLPLSQLARSPPLRKSSVLTSHTLISSIHRSLFSCAVAFRVGLSLLLTTWCTSCLAWAFFLFHACGRELASALPHCWFRFCMLQRSRPD